MKLILGSKSPRRQELLQLIGFEFTVRNKETDESFPETISASEVALYVAHKKNEALLPDLQDDEIQICADTVVIIDSKILGKPTNHVEAAEMLQLLSGREHEVITGVVIQSKDKQIAFSVMTKVFFHPLSLSDINFYIDKYQPFDKAGSYGIQEWIGFTSINKIEGSYTNVVGLPTHEVYQALKNFE